MKCIKQPSFLSKKSTPITEIWEVRLPHRLWAIIKQLSAQTGVTYSTITRLCVFHLAERSHLRLGKAFQTVKKQDMVEYKQAVHHRHMVCLYGEDARLWRLAAMQMGISVSCLIRLALRLYLHKIAMVFHSSRSLFQDLVFWKGIKRWIAIPLIARNHYTLPDIRRFLFQSFPPQLRWGWSATKEAVADELY